MQTTNPILPKFIKASWIVLFVAAIVQSILFPTTPNLLAVATCILAWTSFTAILLRPSVFESYPLSVFVIMGFVSAQFYLPLVVTLLEGKPLVFNLELPEKVFLHSSLILLTLYITHFFYRKIFVEPPDFIQLRLLKIGFYQPPSDLQLWLIGLFGLFAMIVVSLSGIGVKAEAAETSGVGVKFLQGYVPFTYAPFFLLFGKLYGRNSQHIGFQKYYLILFSLALIAVSLARNTRGWFMSGLTSVVFLFVLGLLLSVIITRLFTAKNALILFAMFWLITGPLVDLGIAMVIVRAQRYEITPEQLIVSTLETYKDKSTIRLFKKVADGQIVSEEWDEYYLDNIFLARFCNIKYNDLSLIQAEKISEYDASMFRFSIDRLWAELPRPILNLLKVDIDKDFLNLVSYGDYLYYQAGASSSVLGGKRLGNMAGTGIASFGWWYLLILMILLIPSFMLMDLLILRVWSSSRISSDYRLISARFSISTIISITFLWQCLNAESVLEFGGFLIRGWIQLVLLYLFVYYSAKIVSSVFHST
jgi:hypothetical protein